LIVQWCLKGMSLDGDAEARRIIDQRAGLISNWWRKVKKITPAEVRERLTDANLDLHVNHFSAIDPATDRPFSEHSPFISLSAGTIERDTEARTNHVHSALQTALWYGSEFGMKQTAYLYTCWLVVAPRPAVEIDGVAEEVRDLNAYRRYSAYQTEGEIVAKVHVPDNHIRDCQKWTVIPCRGIINREWVHENPRFTTPEMLSNVRGLI